MSLNLVALGVAVATAALPGGLTILDDATISVNGKTWFNPGNVSCRVNPRSSKFVRAQFPGGVAHEGRLEMG